MTEYYTPPQSAAELVARYEAGERHFPHAQLARAHLFGVDLQHTYLSDANLQGAELWDACWRRASLRGANLEGAILGGAKLHHAGLVGARLVNASLGRAELDGADLHRANLSGAKLSGAELRGVHTLSIEQLRAANTADIRAALYDTLSSVPEVVPALLALVEAGQIDGGSYNGPCADLMGTIARLTNDPQAGNVDWGVTLACGLTILGDSPGEVWFDALEPGDTPAYSPIAALTAEWLRDWPGSA